MQQSCTSHSPMQIRLHTQSFISRRYCKTPTLSEYPAASHSSDRTHWVEVFRQKRPTLLMLTSHYVIICNLGYCYSGVVEKGNTREYLLLKIWQLSLFIHTAWESGAPLNKLDARSFCYNNTRPIQPIWTAKEWFLSLLIWIVATAWVLGPKFVFCWLFWISYLHGSHGSPCEQGEGGRSRKHQGCGLDLKLNSTHLW